MGQCLEGESTYQVFRKSLVGSLFSTENDYADFYAICKTEVHTITSTLNISPSTAFYMVITGEVLVTLSRGDTKPITARTVKPGELINFFHGNKSCAVNGSMVYDKVELALQYRSKDTLTRVIGADYEAIEKFLDDHPHLTALKALYEVNLCDFLTLPAFDTIDPAQMKLLGPLLKLKHVAAGQVITSNQPTNVKFDSSSTLLQSEFKERRGSGQQGANPIGLLLIGSCLAVPSMQLLEVIDHINQGKKRRVVDSIKEAIGIRGSESSTFQPSKESDVDNCLNKYSEQLNTELTRIYPGSLFGLEHYFAKNCNMALDSLMSLETGLVGYIDLETFHALCKIDRRFKRVVLRNFNRSLLDAIKPMIPLLSDMDEKHYTVLTYLISLACYDSNATVFSKGSPSDYSYIVVRGTIKEITTSDPPVQEGEGDQDPANKPPPEIPESVRLLGYGNFFGEVSLVTGTPYFTTTCAVEPTTLIRISKRAFDHIYNNDRISLAELRIKMVGREIEMQHIINHPRGNELFARFCDKELAGENIRFLNDAARYRDICDRLKKEMWSVINQNLLNNIITLDNDKETPTGLSNSDSADSNKDNFFQTAPPSNKVGIKLSRQYSDRIVNRTFPVPNPPQDNKKDPKESKEIKDNSAVTNIEEKRLTAATLKEVNENVEVNAPVKDGTLSPPPNTTNSSKTLFTSLQEQKFLKNIEEIKEVAKMILDKYIKPDSTLEINIPATQKKKILAIFNMVFDLPSVDCLKILQQVVYEMKVIVPRINSSDMLNPNSNKNTVHPSNKHHNMSTPTIPENEEVAAQLILLPNQNDLYPLDSAPAYAHPHENTENPDTHHLQKANSGQFQEQKAYSSRVSTMTSKKDKYNFESPVELLKGVPSDFFDLFRCAQYEIYKLLKNDKFFRWKKTKEFEDFVASVKPYEHNPNEGPTARYTRLIHQSSASTITFRGNESIYTSQKQTPFDTSVKETAQQSGSRDTTVSGIGKSLYMMISPRTSGGMSFYVTADRQGNVRSSVYRAPDEGSTKNHHLPPTSNGHGHQLASIPDNKTSTEDQSLLLESKPRSSSPSKQGSLFSWLKPSNAATNNKIVPHK